MGTVLVLGWQLQVIETGSMEPRIPAGSLAVVEPIDAADVRVGMTIVFEDPAEHGRLVAHRVVARLPGRALAWQTKGDANATADAYPVPATAVEGRVRWTIPHLGSIASSLATPITGVLLVGVPLALLAATELVALTRRRRRSIAEATATEPEQLPVYAVHDLTPGREKARGALVEVFALREDAERYVEHRRRPERELVIVE